MGKIYVKVMSYVSIFLQENKWSVRKFRIFKWDEIFSWDLRICDAFIAGVYTEREGYKGSEYAPTYEDKDGDWMLVGDVPWNMFITSCRRLRLMKGSEAKGLACL